MDVAREQPWATVMLAKYPPMMTLRHVAAVLNIAPRKLRTIVKDPDPDARIVAIKINNVWRFPRDELASYLVAHENVIITGEHA